MSQSNDNQPALEKIAEALVEIGETLETILGFMQEREAGFKARAARASGPRSFGDRKPYDRKPSYKRDDDFGGDDSSGDDGFEDRKPRAPRKSFGDKDRGGPKKFGGGKRAFSADKKPAFKGRGGAGAGAKSSGPRKTYKGGY